MSNPTKKNKVAAAIANTTIEVAKGILNNDYEESTIMDEEDIETQNAEDEKGNDKIVVKNQPCKTSPGRRVRPSPRGSTHNHHHPFFDLSNPGQAIAIRIRELDECCCADVPCISIVKEYCESSSLHGLRYITEDGRHWTERILWVLLCLCGFVLTIYFIYPIWSRWNEKPTITTLDSTDHPVWEIDFPAVTICPANKVSSKNMDKVLNSGRWKETFGSSRDILLNLIEWTFVQRSIVTREDARYENLKQVIETLGLANVTSLMAALMPSCEELMLKCWWQGRKQNCSDIFEVRKTNDGFCCSFNALRQSDTVDRSVLKGIFDLDSAVLQRDLPEGLQDFISVEKKRVGKKGKLRTSPIFLNEDFSVKERKNHTSSPQPSRKEQKIRRLNSANFRRGLTVLLDSHSEDYYVTSEEHVGFKVLIHPPEAFPEVESNSIAIGRGKEFFVSITASHTEGSKAILDFPVEGRSCLFKNERTFLNSEVTIFKDYSQENCLLECRAKILLERCQCLPYYFPRLDLILRERKEFSFIKENGTCTWEGWTCLRNSTDILDAVSPPGQEDAVETFRLIKDGAPCHCPPACARTSYEAAQSYADFPNRASSVMKELLKDKERGREFAESNSRKSDLTLLHIFFRDLKVFKYHTDELFSWENILASFGGLIGLCTGFSFLSAAEFAYFFTLRCTLPICRKRRKDKVAMINETDLVVVKVEE